MLDDYIFGTQYYRAPTPLSTEWEQDIKNLQAVGLNAFQIRVQWRWNEPSEGNYHFDDVDRLFELARLNNQKVIFKFMLETAPQYIYDKYDGERRDFKGIPIRAGTHGAYYIGGWWPCFDNPDVRRRAVRFIEECAKRYKDRPELILWNAWNEPRSRPSEDCACRHSMLAYREWLKSEYKTIENFNSFFGVSEESFETIPVPGLHHGYWDFFLFRKWRGSVVMQGMLKWVYDAIRKYDAKKPVMSHVGSSSCVQSTFYDISDDFAVSKSVDFYGTSYSAPINLKSHKDEIKCSMNPDYFRHINRYFFVHELYPDWGCWTEPVSVEDLRFKIWTIISRGAKGINFWQYRAERLGNENNLAGLMNMDGTCNVRSAEVAGIGRIIRENMKIFRNMEVPCADAAILYDFDSSLISCIEDGNETLWDFSIPPDALKNYSTTHKGMYELFFDMSIPVEYVDTREDLAKLSRFKVVYAPYMIMVRPEVAEALVRYVRNGGVLLADEGIGIRQQNTWLHPSGNDKNLQELLPVRWVERVKNVGADNVILDTGKVTAMPMRTVYKSDKGKVLAAYSNNEPAVHEFVYGKGQVVLFGTSIGYSYAKLGERPWRLWLELYLKFCGLRKNPCDDIDRGIFSRSLDLDNRKVVIIFNRSTKEQTVDLVMKTDARELTGQVCIDIQKGKVTLPAGQVACIIN